MLPVLLQPLCVYCLSHAHTVQVRRTWNSLCMVSKLRREGLVVCHLPAGMLLCCSFKRPVLAQSAVNAVEKACEILWR